MAKTFHQFNKLPPEIRHKIWEAAVRPFDVPGVHFFSLQFRDTSESSTEPRIVDDSIPVPALSRMHSAVLASPNDHGKRVSWDHRDASSYLIDGGLWTACRESNTIIGRLYRKGQPKVWAKELSLSGHKQVRRILPQLDLICLTTSIKGFPLSIFSFDREHESPSSRATDIAKGRMRSKLNIGFDVRHTATVSEVTRSPALLSIVVEENIRMLCSAFQALPPLKMWIVDRKIWMAKASKGGKVFEGLQNLRLVEISTPTRMAGPDQVADDDVSGAWALSLAREINNAWRRHVRLPGGQEVAVVPMLGVLAVEERE